MKKQKHYWFKIKIEEKFPEKFAWSAERFAKVRKTCAITTKSVWSFYNKNIDKVIDKIKQK